MGESFEKTRQLWSALHAFIRNHGGTVTSQPDASPLRFEVLPQNTVVPDLLEQMGYSPRQCGTAEKFMPVSVEVPVAGQQTKAFRDVITQTSVAIFEIELPKVK